MNTKNFYNDMMSKLIQYTMHHSMQITRISKLKVNTSLVVISKYTLDSGIRCKIIYRRETLCTIHIEDLERPFIDFIREHIQDLDFTIYLESDVNNQLELLVTQTEICVVDQDAAVRASFTLGELATHSLSSHDTLSVEPNIKTLEIDTTALSLGNFIVLLKQLSKMYTQQFGRTLYQSLDVTVEGIHLDLLQFEEELSHYIGLYVLYNEEAYTKRTPLTMPVLYTNHMSQAIGESIELFLSKCFFQRTTEELTQAYKLSEADWLQIHTDAFKRYQKVDFITIKYTLYAWVKESRLSAINDPYYHLSQVYIDMSKRRELTKHYYI